MPQSSPHPKIHPYVTEMGTCVQFSALWDIGWCIVRFVRWVYFVNVWRVCGQCCLGIALNQYFVLYFCTCICQTYILAYSIFILFIPFSLSNDTSWPICQNIYIANAFHMFIYRLSFATTGSQNKNTKQLCYHLKPYIFVAKQRSRRWKTIYLGFALQNKSIGHIQGFSFLESNFA